MPESYRYLDLNGERLFASIHGPAGTPTRGVVLCHPLGEEKLWAHRVFASLAREVAASGLAALRFDFRGEGDSDRGFEASDFETRVEDTNLAIDSLRDAFPTVEDVALIGLRLGAAVAAAAGSRRSDVSRLILWDPIVDGAAYMQAVLRLNLMFQMALHHRVVENRDALVAKLISGRTVNIEGYELAEPLFRQVSQFQLQRALAAFVGDAVIVQIDQGDTAPRAELTALAADNPRCRVEVVQEEAFWREIKSFYQRAPELSRVTLQALGVST